MNGYRLQLDRCLAAVLLLGAASAIGSGQDREPAPPPPANAREVLARYGIGPAEFSQFVDGNPITGEEEAVLAKILLRFSRLGLDNIHRWRKQTGDFSAIAAATHREQGELFALRGRTTLVSEQSLPPPLAEQYEFGRYYAVQMALEGSPRQALVLTRVVPRAWKIGQPLDEPAAADGLLLKVGPADESGSAPLVFAAGRVGWYPASSPLARAGFDTSLFDAVRGTNGQGLVAADREPFYRLLAAVGKLAASQPAPAPQLEVVPLLQQPEKHHGELVTLRGKARRIVMVHIRETGLKERLGLDHYYEIDTFVPLGEARLRFDGDNPGGGNPNAADPPQPGPTFENTYPVTLIARRLPAGLVEGENLHVEIAADAVFFKLWTYESIYMARHGRVQPAPLLVTNEPRIATAASHDAGVWNTAITLALVGMLLVMVLAWWWYERENRSSRIITTRATG